MTFLFWLKPPRISQIPYRPTNRGALREPLPGGGCNPSFIFVDERGEWVVRHRLRIGGPPMELPFTTAHDVFQFGFVIGKTEFRSTPGCLPVTTPRVGLRAFALKSVPRTPPGHSWVQSWLSPRNAWAVVSIKKQNKISRNWVANDMSCCLSSFVVAQWMTMTEDS